MHSTTGRFTKLLAFLNSREIKHPNTNPINIEKNEIIMKSTATTGMDFVVNFEFFFANLATVLKRIIVTASLTIPSPKTRLNNLGYSLGLTIDMAAITSEEQSKAHIKTTSICFISIVVTVSQSAETF